MNSRSKGQTQTSLRWFKHGPHPGNQKLTMEQYQWEHRQGSTRAVPADRAQVYRNQKCCSWALSPCLHQVTFKRVLFKLDSTQVQSLEKGTAMHSSTLVWKISRTRGAWWTAVCGISKSETQTHL